MSSISAGTSAGTALVSTGDTTGALVFKTGASATTAMTIGADQSVTFAGAVSGTPGSGGATASGSVVLTSASAGAQSITTTNYGQSITLPDATTLSKGACLYTINNLGSYPLKILNNAGSTLGFAVTNNPVTVGLADNSTSAGTWSLVDAEPYAPVAQLLSTSLYTAGGIVFKSLPIDSTRTLLIIGNTSLNGIIYDSSTLTWGSLTLIRTGTIANVNAILSATNQVLACSINTTTGMEAVVLTLSGTTITVGIAATATLSATNNTGIYNLISVGTSFVTTYAVATPANQMRALSISGTTVTIGAATVLNGTLTSDRIYAAAVSSSVALVTTCTSASTFFATPYTISGTTITLGTGATYSTTSAFTYKIQPISNGVRWAAVISNTATTSAIGLIISVAGTTATISTVTLATTTNANGTGDSAVFVSGSKLIFLSAGEIGSVNILTDSAGTASAGTAITVPSGGAVYPIKINSTTNKATFLVGNGSLTAAGRVVIDFSGASPVLSAFDLQTASGSAIAIPNAATFSSSIPGNMLVGQTSYAFKTTAAGTRATAIGENTFYTFIPKYTISAASTLFSNDSSNKSWQSVSAVLATSAPTYALIQLLESTT